MDFVVAANSGTHIYRAQGLEKPALLRSLPTAAPSSRCLEFCDIRGCLAILQHNGIVSVWDLTCDQSVAACEVTTPSRVARCYWSPKGSFLVTWEPITTFSRADRRGTFTKPENLSVWHIAARPQSEEFDVEIVKDGKSKLGVNVDNLDGQSGLLIRRVDPGLMFNHNASASECSTISPGDKILSVNGTGPTAQAMTEEIQCAQTLRLRVCRGSAWRATITTRFFTPSLSPLRWPPVLWGNDEVYAFRSVTNEVQILDGTTLKLLRRLQIDNVLQTSVTPTLSRNCPTLLAAFCPATTTASPAMVRLFRDFGKAGENKVLQQPFMTKAFFSAAAWVTMRWDGMGTDLLVLVHSSELSDADMEGRTLHGQGGNGLFLLRTDEVNEPIASLYGTDGVIFDVQWCPDERAEMKSLVVLEGPQPAMVSIVSYRRGKGELNKINLGRFGVRNCLRWDGHGRSFCLRVQSLRGAGVSSEADSIDLFDASPEGPVARRAGNSVGGKRDKEQAIGPSISSVDFSPDGCVLLVSVQAHFGAELKFLNTADGAAIYRLKFEDVYAARWRPCPLDSYAPPEFQPPPPEARFGALAGGAIVEVELRDRDAVKRRMKARGNEQLVNQQPERVATEIEGRETLKQLDADLELLSKPDVLAFEIQTAWGTHILEYHCNDTCRDIAKQFCRERRLDDRLSGDLADRMEEKLKQPLALAQPKRPHGPKPKVVDLGDKNAVKRRVRALQKKLREMERLKNLPDSELDTLQREKLANEGEVRRTCESLERELNLLERLPRMVFDVETDTGLRFIEFRDGDSCLELSRVFCSQHALDDELIGPLAEHMEEKLRDQEILESPLQDEHVVGSE